MIVTHLPSEESGCVRTSSSSQIWPTWSAMGNFFKKIPGYHLVAKMSETSEEIRKAGRNVSSCVFEDNHLSDPYILLQNKGMSSRDYEFNADGSIISLKKLFVLPDILLSQFNQNDLDGGKSFMGIFPQIGRSWMSINNRLYLWQFDGSCNDINCWEGTEDIIIDVAIVKPKPGVFIDAVEWLLVVITPGEIHLVGVSWKNNDLILHTTGLSFGTDSVTMLSCKGTPEGRIFCSGQDGHLYELAYQSKEGWFTRKCRKISRTGSVLSSVTPNFLKLTTSGAAIHTIAYDCTNGLLWALSESDQLQLFWLGNSRWDWINLGTVGDFPSRLAKFTTIAEPIQVVSIHVVSSRESKVCQLVGVCSNGARVFFSAFKPGGTLPSGIDILHVRLDHPDDLTSRIVGTGRYNLLSNRMPSGFKNIHSSYYTKGLYLSASPLSDQEDLISVSLLKQTAAFSPASEFEESMEVKINGKVWAFAEKELANDSNCCSSVCWSGVTRPQFDEKRQIYCLTNVGVYIFEVKRPMDVLLEILKRSEGNMESESTNTFFCRMFPSEQAISIAIFLLMLSDDEDLVKLWALQAVSKHSGEPVLNTAGLSGNINISNLALNSLSPLHVGLYHVFSRIIGNIWKMSIDQISLNLDSVQSVIHLLARFVEIYTKNSSLFSRVKTSSTMTEEKSTAYKLEQESLRQLGHLAQVSAELLEFITICHDYRLHIPSSFYGFPVDFELLVTSPSRGLSYIHDLARELVNRQLSLQASVESLCEILKNRCPSFFSPSDLLFFEGTEALAKALKSAKQSSYADTYTNDSFKAFLAASSKISIDQFKEIRLKFEQIGAFVEILRLGLKVAEHMTEANDRDGIFGEILASMNVFLDSSRDDLDFKRQETFEVCFSSENVEFLNRFYDWLFTHELATSTILSLSGPEKFLESYLEREAIGPDGQVNKAVSQMLWKYYVKFGKQVQAAQLLIQLAKTVSKDICIAERIENLSLAINNLKGVTVQSPTVSAVLEEAEEILEVALVQFDLLKLCKSQGKSEQTVADLNLKLYSATDLFLRFSKPLKFPEISLEIVKLTCHKDPVLVSQLWNEALFEAGQDLESVGFKFQHLATKLSSSECAFPMPYLIDVLLLLSFQEYAETDELVIVDWFVSLWSNTPVPLNSVRCQIEKLLSPSCSNKYWIEDEAKSSFLKLVQTAISRATSY